MYVLYVYMYPRTDFSKSQPTGRSVKSLANRAITERSIGLLLLPRAEDVPDASSDVI
jgi:hypothetical protein